jgi:hypothetical protein
MEIITLIQFLIRIIILNLFQNLKVFFGSAIEYFHFNKKFENDLNILKDLLKFKLKIKSNEIFIITEVYDNSIMYCYNLLVHAKKIQRIKKLPIVVLDDNFSFIKKKFYKSFEINNIFYLNSFIFTLFIIIKNFKTILKEFSKIYKIKKTDDLSYNYNGIEISNIAYDSYLRFNFSGTVDNIKKFKFYILKSLMASIKLKYILHNKKIDCFAGKENQFIPRANLFQYLLKRDCICYFFFGPGNASSVRKFKRFSQRTIPRAYINKRFYLYAFSKKENFIKKSKEILDKKFLSVFHKNELLDAKSAFSKNHYNLSREEFFEKYRLDEKKKLVVLFSHNIYDGVFEIRRKLFIDNLIWLKETLKILSQNQNINVLVKKHPTEYSAKSIKDISIKAIEEIPDLKHNNIIPYPENLSPQFIRQNADCIVTGHGTVGVEYACYGIPSVSCNNSPYSYCATSNEAKSYVEYVNILKNIHKIVRLNKNQIEKSLVLFFLMNKVDKNKNEFYSSVPDFHPSELVGFQKKYEYRHLEKIFEKIRNIKNIEHTNIYQKYSKFIGSNDYGMYNINELKSNN